MITQKILVRQQVLPEAEVGDRHAVGELVQDEVAQLQVPVHNVAIVEASHGLGDVVEYLKGFLFAEPLLLYHVLLQVDELWVARTRVGGGASFEHKAQVSLKTASVHWLQARLVYLRRRILFG